jgi:V8-like Glu-specific endopeptidase
MTNGHCFEDGYIPIDKIVSNISSTRKFAILNPAGGKLGVEHATKIIYGTMTKTDLLIYQLEKTYQQIKETYNIRPFELSSAHPKVGDNIDVVSGYWQKGYSCAIEAFVYKLVEEGWVNEDSMRYSRPGCAVIGGTSGSPVILQGTRTIVGINSTGNDYGEKCTESNPCEVDKNGNIIYVKGYSYAQETYWVYSCLNDKNEIDLSAKGCLLFH